MADFVRMGAPEWYAGLSTDDKPASAPAGSRCYETDTGAEYIWNGTAWVSYAPDKYLTDVSVSGTLTAKTGRAATITVAANNSTALEKAQADYVCDGVNDEVQIAAAINALSTVSWTGFWDNGGTGATFTISSKTGSVRLAAGDYQIDSTMSVTNSFYQFQMIGYGAIIHNNQAGANHAFQFNINNNSRNLSFEGIAWIGNSYVATGAGDNVYITSSGGSYGEMIHGISFINVYNSRAGRYGIAVDSDNNTVGVRIIGSTFGELFPLTGQSSIRDGNKVHDIYARNVHHAAVSDSVFEGTGGSSIYLDSFTAEWSITGNQFHYLNAWNAALTAWTQTPVIRVVYGTNITITGNRIEAALHGIGIGTAASASSDIVITGNTISTSGATGQCIYLDNADNVTIVGNNLFNNNVNNAPIDLSRTTAGTGIIIHSNRIHTDQTTRHIINNNSSTNVNIKNNVHTGGNADYIYPMGEDLAIISGNTGSGAARRGETRFGYASLTAGNANAIAFAWNNPETVEIFIKKIVIEVRTGGGTVGSHLDVGIADNATGTNRGTEFFNDILLNNAGIYDSWVAGDGGTQTKWVFAEDSAAAVDDWVVGQILDANAASLVGSVYIEYVVRQS